MTQYCLGFAFTDHDNFVILIRKNKPAWQKGLLNGVGGESEKDAARAYDRAALFHFGAFARPNFL